jgi:NAD(P)-dependent dehydrogenase (short-subunit alcohol dehydrogenase family)
MRIDLSGRTVSVTGSGQGIRKAIAKEFAEAGARVAVNGRYAGKVHDAVAKLTAQVPGTDVTVNSVIAGPTHTGGVEDFVYQLVNKGLSWDEAQREFMRLHRPQLLLQRLIEPEEIANICLSRVTTDIGDHWCRWTSRRRLCGLHRSLTFDSAATVPECTEVVL